MSSVGTDTADARGVHPRVTQSGSPVSNPRAQNGAQSETRNGSDGTPAARSPVQHTPAPPSAAHPATAAAVGGGKPAVSPTPLTAGAPRSLADAIAQAARNSAARISAGTTRAGHAKATVPGTAAARAASAAMPVPDAAVRAAALLRQAIVAYAPSGAVETRPFDDASAGHAAPLAATPSTSAHR